MDAFDDELRQRLGLMPNFFRVSPESPEIAPKLWGFACFGYLHNPLPPLFKERLFIWLSRFCDERSCIVRHVGFLACLGRVVGDEHCPPQSLNDILHLLRKPVPVAGELQALIDPCCALKEPLAELPAPDSELESAIFACATHIFLRTSAERACLAALRHALGPSRMEQCLMLLAFIRTTHFWTELHPDVDFEEDVRNLLAQDPQLNGYLRGEQAQPSGEFDQGLLAELDSLRRQKQELERESQRRLESDLADSRLLHEISNELIGERKVDTLYAKIVDAAARLMRSESASMQVVRDRPDGSKALELLCHCGFTPAAASEWERLPMDTSRPCGAALASGKRVVVTDVGQCDFMARSEQLEMYRRLGIRAIQTTPLYSRDGTLVGTISTHWQVPHAPSEHEFQMFDILGRQAADLIERAQAGEALHASEKRLQTIIEQMPAGVGVIDMNGAWTLSNSLMDVYVPKALPARPPDRLASWRAWDEHGHEIPPERWPGNRALRGETAVPGLEMLYTDDTRLDHWMRVSAAPLRNDAGEVTGACCVAQDITQLKQAEQALKDADRRKDEFLATLAHELRNPLAPIRNGLQFFRLAGANGEAAERVHGMLERQVEHLVRLVDDLLEVSRITGGKVELRKEPVDLAAMLHNAVETSRSLIDAAGHRLTIGLPPEALTVDADPVRLTQIIANLLNNAAKYTDKGGQIWLAAHREGADAVVSVRDNGMGIPESMLPKIFDLFTQAERTYSRAQGGLGIGLTLVRSLVELHGGSVEARSGGPGRGSEFLVRLPIAPGPRETASSPRPDSADFLAGCRILIVDDSRDAADSLAMLMELYGADVRIAGDGPAALATLGEFQPDAIMLDIGMPGMDGYEVARRVRELPAGADLTLIALSGWGQEEDRRRSKQAGIDHHLVKPVDLELLNRLLADMWKKRAGGGAMPPD